MVLQQDKHHITIESLQKLLDDLNACDQQVHLLLQEQWRDDWLTLWVYWKQQLGLARTQLRWVLADVQRYVQMRVYHDLMVAGASKVALACQEAIEKNFS